MQKYPITPEGFNAMRYELNNLKNVERPSIIAAIQAARELGDLSENAEYHSAKEKQSFIEGKIADLEAKLSRAEVIDVKKLQGDDVKFGTTITVDDLDDDISITYKIVGIYESDIKRGYISFTSPIAKGLIGKTKGDIILIKTPGGEKNYEITKIEYI